MATHTIKKQPKATIEISLLIPWTEIQSSYKSAFDALLPGFEMVGFRKGKVPRELAEKNLSKDKVYSKLIQTLIPKLYEEIIKKENLKPIVSPKVELIKAKENEEWEIKIQVAEKPEVKLKDYKKKVQESKKKVQAPEIWVPGKDEKPAEKNKEAQREKILNSALETLITEVECEVSPLLIEDELDRRLTQVVDDVQKIGLTIESYLKSKGTTIELLKERLAKEVTEMYKLEFILQAIADEEKIEVNDADLQKIFGNIKEEKDRQAAQQNAYFYASVLRKQKALDFIIGL